VFGAHRNAHQRLSDAGGFEFRRGKLAVGCRHRMASESFNRTEAYRILRDLQTSQEFESTGLAIFDFERQERTGIIGLGVTNPDLFGVSKL
jgi:hypothetical protein